jgi:hypothetical protein
VWIQLAAAWIWISGTLILTDVNALGMDLYTLGTIFSPWGKGCTPKQPPECCLEVNKK